MAVHFLYNDCIMKDHYKMSERHIKIIALFMASSCVRNTVIEEYHGNGKITDPEMAAFNKQVVNKLYTWLHIAFNGTPGEQSALMKSASMYYPRNWDEPVIDDDITKAVKMIIENPGLLPKNES